MNKKILVSMMVIGLVATLTGAGLYAYFSDTETSTGNIFTAGTLDLKVDWTEYYNGDLIETQPETDDPGPIFELSDVKPGDYGEATISLHVTNDAWARVVAIINYNSENGMNEPESEVDTTWGTWSGELHKYLRISMWLDDGDNVWEDGEPYLYAGYTGPDDPDLYDPNAYVPVKDALIAEIFPDLLLYPDEKPPSDDEFCIIPGYLKECEIAYIGISWRVDEDAGNEMQSDSISVTVIFEAKQYRNFEDDGFRFMNEPKHTVP